MKERLSEPDFGKMMEQAEEKATVSVEREFPQPYTTEENGDQRFTEEAQDLFNELYDPLDDDEKD